MCLNLAVAVDVHHCFYVQVAWSGGLCGGQ